MPGIDAQQAEGHRVVDLGVPDQVRSSVGDLRVVAGRSAPGRRAIAQSGARVVEALGEVASSRLPA